MYAREIAVIDRLSLALGNQLWYWLASNVVLCVNPVYGGVLLHDKGFVLDQSGLS